MDSGNENEEGSSYDSGQEDDHSSGSCSRDSSGDSYSSCGSNNENGTHLTAELKGTKMIILRTMSIPTVSPVVMQMSMEILIPKV